MWIMCLLVPADIEKGFRRALCLTTISIQQYSQQSVQRLKVRHQTEYFIPTGIAQHQGLEIKIKININELSEIRDII